MPSAKLAASQLLLLLAAPGSVSALRTAVGGRGAPEPTGEQNEALVRQSRRAQTRTLRSFKEDIRKELADIPGLKEFPEAMLRKNRAAEKLPDLTGVAPECSYAADSTCAMAGKPRGEPFAVKPGGKTRCIFGDEFLFTVFPGDTDKLVLHMDGGGACWDEVTTVGMQACLSDPYVAPIAGLYNKCPGENPFAGYTAITMPQCSGDLNIGDVERPYRSSVQPDIDIVQRGYQNVLAVLDWIKANMDTKLTHLVLTGESAGAIGMQVWSSKLLRDFQYDSATVLADSYTGVFPENFTGQVVQDMNACELDLFSGSLLESCRNGSLTIPDVFESRIREFPNVTFGQVNSKHDVAQVLFYNAAVGSMRVRRAKEYCGEVDPNECDLSNAPAGVLLGGDAIEPDAYHSRMQTIIERYSSNPNYFFNLMSGNAHTIFVTTFGTCPDMDYLNVETGFGGWIDGAEGEQRLRGQQWATELFKPNGAQRYSRCESLLESEGDDYCSELIQSKLQP